MSGEYLLDTCVVIDLMDVAQTPSSLKLEDRKIVLSTIVAGELLYGAELTTRRRYAEILDPWLSSLQQVPCDAGTAVVYGRLRAQLRRKGRPIPDNDIWIAATASQHGLTLVSRDAHFESIDGLLIERWT